MRKYHSVLCALLSSAMVFAFAACDRTINQNDAVSMVPSETDGGSSAKPEKETPAAEMDPVESDAQESDTQESAMEETNSVPTVLDFSGGSQVLIMTSLEEYEQKPTDIQPGTVLNYLARRANPPENLVPWRFIQESWLTGNIYEGLLYMYMNDPEDIRGCIAQSWEHSDDYLTWTFQIRDGITFTDGTVCDAYAVAKSWDNVLKVGETGSRAFEYYHIVSWEAKSAKEFVVHMSAPCAYFETDLCGSSCLMIASPTALQIYGVDDSRVAVGTGPYYIASFDEKTGYVLKANKAYYLEEKMPCIETINLKSYDYRYYALQALLNGEIDGAAFNSATGYLIGLPNSADYGPLETYQALLRGGYGGTIVRCLGEVCPMWFNAKNVKPFRTREVREAMCRFIDFNAINDRIYDGMGGVQDSLWARGTAGYVATDRFYCDPEEGRELLASVGMEASQIQIRDQYSYYQEDIFTEIVNELDEAGVVMDVKPIHIAASFTPLGQGTWQMILHSGFYDNTRLYFSWAIVLKDEYSMKLSRQDIYDPELYQKMLDEYNAMNSASTWEYMAARCRQLTSYEQDDFGAIGTVQPPAFLTLSKDFKNGIYFSESHDIQLYYLYK